MRVCMSLLYSYLSRSHWCLADVITVHPDQGRVLGRVKVQAEGQSAVVYRLQMH